MHFAVLFAFEFFVFFFALYQGLKFRGLRAMFLIYFIFFCFKCRVSCSLVRDFYFMYQFSRFTFRVLFLQLRFSWAVDPICNILSRGLWILINFFKFRFLASISGFVCVVSIFVIYHFWTLLPWLQFRIIFPAVCFIMSPHYFYLSFCSEIIIQGLEMY